MGLSCDIRFRYAEKLITNSKIAAFVGLVFAIAISLRISLESYFYKNLTVNLLLPIDAKDKAGQLIQTAS